MIVGKQSRASKIFDAANVIFMIVILLLTLYPLWYVVVGSFNKGLDFMKGGVYFFPRALLWKIIRRCCAKNPFTVRSGVTALRTVIGTVGHIVVVLTFAYGSISANSRKELLRDTLPDPHVRSGRNGTLLSGDRQAAPQQYLLGVYPAGTVQLLERAHRQNLFHRDPRSVGGIGEDRGRGGVSDTVADRVSHFPARGGGRSSFLRA